MKIKNSKKRQMNGWDMTEEGIEIKKKIKPLGNSQETLILEIMTMH